MRRRERRRNRSLRKESGRVEMGDKKRSLQEMEIRHEMV